MKYSWAVIWDTMDQQRRKRRKSANVKHEPARSEVSEARYIWEPPPLSMPSVCECVCLSCLWAFLVVSCFLPRLSPHPYMLHFLHLTLSLLGWKAKVFTFFFLFFGAEKFPLVSALIKSFFVDPWRWEICLWMKLEFVPVIKISNTTATGTRIPLAPLRCGTTSTLTNVQSAFNWW